MGVCVGKPVGVRRSTMERRGTDSSAPLLNANNSDRDLKNFNGGGSNSSMSADVDPAMCSRADEIYYDALDEEVRHPLTLAAGHHYVPFEGLEEKLQEAIARHDKSEYMNAYTEPPADIFLVRGPNYLSEGKGGKNLKNLKVPSGESPYELIGVNFFRAPDRIKHVSQEIGDLRRYFDTFPADKEGTLFPEFLSVNWLLSPLFKKEFFVVQHVFRLRPGARDNLCDAPLSNAMGRFMNGTDAERNSQFKYVFRCVDAPSAVKNAISYLGGERPVLIGKSLTTSYNTGRNYLEINMDVSSSRIASAINGIVFKNVETVVMDCSWLLEGQRDEELPERVLAKLRWIWNSADQVLVELDEAGERIQ